MSLHFERRGTGRPLSLVHGLGGSVRYWDTLAPVSDPMLRELAIGQAQDGTAFRPGRITIGWGRNGRLLLPRQAVRIILETCA